MGLDRQGRWSWDLVVMERGFVVGAGPGWPGLLETFDGGKKVAIGRPLGLSRRLVGRQNEVLSALCYVPLRNKCHGRDTFSL
jgi:hypothetical protein